MIDPSPDPVLASTNFRVTAADVTAAQRKHMRWLARRGRTWAFLLAITAFCGIAVPATISGGWTPFNMSTSAAGGLAWMIVWSLIVYMAMPLFARRGMKTQPNLGHEWRVDLSERGMRAVTPNQDNFVAWGDYVAWSEDACVILFYQGEQLFQFIPKRGLEPGFMDVVHRLATHLPKR